MLKPIKITISLKNVLLSLGLPFSVLVIIPIIFLIFIEKKSKFFILYENILLIIIIICGFCLIGLGTILFSYCVIIFYKIGKGTLFPKVTMHTNHMVIVGPYKYVRNPMILGVFIILVGEALFFLSFSIFLYSIGFLIINMIYMPLSEEKGLKARFGEEFLQYKKQVRSWIPNSKPYEPRKQKVSEDNKNKQL